MAYAEYKYKIQIGYTKIEINFFIYFEKKNDKKGSNYKQNT